MTDITEPTNVPQTIASRSPSLLEPPALALNIPHSGPPASIGSTDPVLADINWKMGTMAELIGQLCTKLDEREAYRATGRDGSSSLHRRARSLSSSSNSSMEAPDDQLSVRASEDELEELIQGKSSSSDKTKEKNTESRASATDTLLNELEASLTEDDKQGPPITQKLADIATKRWGKKLEPDQVKSLLAKHEVPENCPGLRAPRVNLEVWHELNSLRRTADLRLHNTQKSMLKAMSAVLYMCDRVLGTDGVAKEGQKSMLGNGIDAVALLSHAIADLSCLRREQMKPALKQEIHSLCTKELTEASTLLFGDDLAKQIRDAKETTRIGKALAGSKPGPKGHKRRHSDYQRHNGQKRGHFLSKSQKSGAKKKFSRDDSK